MCRLTAFPMMVKSFYKYKVLQQAKIKNCPGTKFRTNQN